MAIISPIHGEMRGSIGGSTWSRNRGGQYVKQRATPVNPNSSRQQVVRSILATLAQAWGGLTTAEREAWNTYAQENPVLNSLGQEIYLTGLDWFVKINSRLSDAGDTLLDEPPIGPGPGSLSTLSIAFTDATTITVTFTPGLAADERLQVWTSLPQGTGTSPNFKQCRLAGYTAAEAESPASVTLPFSFQIGERAVVYVAIIDDEGITGGYLRAEATRAA